MTPIEYDELFLDTIRAMITEIYDEQQWDDEFAHWDEDYLHRYVLRECASGDHRRDIIIKACELALVPSDFSFARWYA